MIKILIALAVILSACVPTVRAFSYYEATGSNAQTRSPCGPPRSFFQYPLEGTFAERIEVRIRKSTGTSATHLVSVVAVSRSDKTVSLAPGKISVLLNGQRFSAGNIETLPLRSMGNLSIATATANFNLGTATPANILVNFGPGTIRVNGRDFGLAQMNFDWVVKTKAVLQAVNC